MIRFIKAACVAFGAIVFGLLIGLLTYLIFESNCGGPA